MIHLWPGDVRRDVNGERPPDPWGARLGGEGRLRGELELDVPGGRGRAPVAGREVRGGGS